LIHFLSTLILVAITVPNRLNNATPDIYVFSDLMALKQLDDLFNNKVLIDLKYAKD